jgi:urea transport system substrate-binding protein
MKIRSLVLFPLISCFHISAWADEIKVGILHSKTGTMAISELAVIESTKLAIDEINANGGLLGKKIIAIEKDGKSDWDTFALEATNLIKDDKVSVVFGCWTSSSRKTVAPIFEKYQNLLFYPVQFEGLEKSPNIIYTGAAPNQQLIPAARYFIGEQKKKNVFLVGSDYVFPRSANAILRSGISKLRGNTIGEMYIKLGSKDVDAVVSEIIKTKPDVIFNTINGDTNVAFFSAMRKAGIFAKEPLKPVPNMQIIPTVSFSIAEQELLSMNLPDMEGDYAVWNYFQSIDSNLNTKLVSAFKAKYGDHRVFTDPMEAAYFGVKLWAEAVKLADSVDPVVIRKIFKDKEIAVDAPEGRVYVDRTSGYTWKMVRIGQIQLNGQFRIISSSEKPIQPDPFPYKKEEEWKVFLSDMFNGWNKNWAAP